MKNLFTLTVAIIFANLLFGQTGNWEEVVYLKNGSVIRGTIIEQVPNKTIKVQTKDRNIFVYNMDEVEKIAKEEIKDEQTNQTTSNKFDNSKIKESGFSNVTEIGGILGVGNTPQGIYGYSNHAIYPNSTNLFSLTTICGYQIKRQGFIGVGLGTEVSKSVINLPFFLDGRYYLLKKRVTPFIAVGGGYALSWLQNTFGGTFTKSGALAYSQLGVRIYVSKNLSWIFGLGYRFQPDWTSQIYTDKFGQNIGKVSLDRYSHFFTIKTGLTF